MSDEDFVRSIYPDAEVLFWNPNPPSSVLNLPKGYLIGYKIAFAQVRYFSLQVQETKEEAWKYVKESILKTMVEKFEM